jgi:hypothetical protein
MTTAPHKNKIVTYKFALTGDLNCKNAYMLSPKFSTDPRPTLIELWAIASLNKFWFYILRQKIYTVAFKFYVLFIILIVCLLEKCPWTESNVPHIRGNYVIKWSLLGF